MSVGFSGEVARLYETYRRGYPDAVVDAIVDAFELTSDDIAVDLGCGPGQLTFPLAAYLRAVVGVDPEADMLALARRAAEQRSFANIAWLLGTDADMPALESLLGPRSVGVVTAATALHWMRDDEVFRATARLVRPGGGFTVVTNGKPLWQQDVAWSYALREFIESWNGVRRLHRRPGSGAPGRRDALRVSGASAADGHGPRGVRQRHPGRARRWSVHRERTRRPDLRPSLNLSLR